MVTTSTPIVVKCKGSVSEVIEEISTSKACGTVNNRSPTGGSDYWCHWKESSAMVIYKGASSAYSHEVAASREEGSKVAGVVQYGWHA